MPANQEKLAKLREIMKITTEGLTKSEFLSSFKAVINHVLKTEVKLIEKVDLLSRQLKGENNKLSESTQASLSDLTEELNKDMATALKQQKTSLEFIYDKMRRVKNGLNGKNGLDGLDGEDADQVDIDKLIKKVLDEIEVPEVDLDKVKEDIEELKERPIGKLGGGGFSKIHMESKMIDDETLSGTVNGSNKVFLTTNTPNPPASLKVFRGGARQRITEDYTFTGRTITFIIAPVSGEVILVDYRK